MKKLTFLVLSIIPLWLNAQIPSYYNDVNLSLSGMALKSELATKITNTHTNFLSYSLVWDASKITDLDPVDATQSNVILIYGYNDTDGNYVTDRTRSKNANGGTAGTDWNREHSYVKSLGTPNLGTSGPGADAHHLRPTDVTFNGQRGSKKFATGSGNAGDSNGGWYPGDEWKGDIARMMMYMYLRYESRCLPTGVGMGNAAATPDNMIDLFLQWNADDPVSLLEKNRNTYHGSTSNTFAQGNRNPFIDNPAFATQMWGGPQAEDLFGNSSSDTITPSVPTNLAASNTTQTSTDLSWTASTDNVGVTAYNVFKNGVLLVSTTTSSHSVTALSASTSYTFTVTAKDAAGNVSAPSNAANITTLTDGGNTNGDEIFISEYIEGSSNNKAIEIANFTGSSVNLSVYSLKRNTNGGTSWSAALNLSGQLANADVFVVANSSATAAILNVADLSSGANAMLFNGNDPVGLFKNNVLIDIIGNFNNGTANFAANITLRRKETIANPSTTYNTNEWNSFPSDTFDGLGTHTISGGNNGGLTDILLEHSFETGWDGWIDGGTDCYRINSTRSFDGNYSIRIRDNTGTQSSVTSGTYNVTAYTNLEIKFNFYSYSMENNEDFWLQYFDGSVWHTVKAFARGTDFNNNEFTAATVNIASSVYDFPANAQFRFQCDASSNADEIYIDNVIVTATGNTGTKSGFNTDKLSKIYIAENHVLKIDKMEVYPNPASKNITLRAEINGNGYSSDLKVDIVNLQGKLVKSLKFNGIKNKSFMQNIDVSNLRAGLYFINFISSEGFKKTTRLVIE